MAGAQDWCLQCGAGAPGSLGADAPGWRSAATILAVTGILVLGAAAAAYAALTKEGPHKPRPVTVAVAQAPVPATPIPATPGTVTPTPTPTPATPGALPPAAKVPATPSANPLFTGSANPPKIPLTTPAPKSSPTTTAPESKSSGGTSTEKTPAAIQPDTNAATTYNPYSYPASEFGDPSLAIDGETSTAWTAQVNPAVAPKMAEGLVIDLKTARRLSAVGLITSTPRMSVQVYGANGHTLPTSITDPAWVQLSSYVVTKKRSTRIKLRNATKAFRFVTLWISKAPTASIGTAPNRVPPTHVSVNEFELFPAK
jgi:hypothetical protein